MLLKSFTTAWLFFAIIEFVSVSVSLGFITNQSTTQRWSKARISQSLLSSTAPNEITTSSSAEAPTSTYVQEDKETSNTKNECRTLGSQELLMLPRQYSPNPDVKFPQMNHVSAFILSETPKNEDHLKNAITTTMLAHPLLHSYVKGDGEPTKRIDLFNMVREGEPNPCTFVPNPSFSVEDVLTMVSVESTNAESDRALLDQSWKSSFEHDLDNGSWCHVEKGPLWKVEFHRFTTNTDTTNEKKPCALVFSFNHVISDQSSANKIADQILYHLAANEANEEDGGKALPAKPIKQSMPIALEDSVMGINQRWKDVQVKGVSVGTLLYVAGKAAEGIRNPVILPDPPIPIETEEAEALATGEDESNKLLGALSIISGKAAGGQDDSSEQRKSTVQYRTLSKENTSQLLSKCRANAVTITNALTAAMTLTSADFIDNGTLKSKSRNYKVLQSMDMRRFGDCLDKGTTVACMAGSMDLMHGPINDRTGLLLRLNPSPHNMKTIFWDLAKDGKKQTDAFIKSNGPYHAVRVFDFAMTIADLNNLVYLTAQSKDTKGRAYSAGVANIGVYENQYAYENENDNERKKLQTQHGRFRVDDIHFATSHARSGCLFQLSCLSVGGEMKLTFHPAAPIVTEEMNNKFADTFIDLLMTVINN